MAEEVKSTKKVTKKLPKLNIHDDDDLNYDDYLDHNSDNDNVDYSNESSDEDEYSDDYDEDEQDIDN